MGALDEIEPEGYSDGAYKTSRRGVAIGPPFRFNLIDLLSPAAAR